MQPTRHRGGCEPPGEPLARCRGSQEKRRRVCPAWLVAFVVLGCGPSLQQLQDGSLQLECRASLAACTGKASRYCEGQGCEILHGSQDQDSSRVVFRCRQQAMPKLLSMIVPGPSASTPPPSAGSARGAPSAPRSPAHQPSGPARVCVPGATQRCVGAGACQGGQACLPSGAGFGPCQCSRGSAVDAGASAESRTDASAGVTAGVSQSG
jgi:hypothetical protein